MSLLSIANVTKRYRRGRLERVAVRDILLYFEAGQLVAVWGARFSGRSTLLRVAAGIESPEEGTVTFEGNDLAQCRDSILGRRIGYCQTGFASSQRGLVIEHVAAGLLAQRVSPKQTRRRGQELLFRVGAEHCAQLHCHGLAGA